jgi:hypothetical protein
MIKKTYSRFYISLLLILFFSFPSQAYSDLYGQRNSVNAGFYLHIPFGPTRKNDDRLKYGLRLNMSQQFSNGPGWRDEFSLGNRQYLNMDLMSLNFTESGFRDMSLAGRQAFVYQDGLLKFADDSKKKGGTSPLIWVFAGLGALVLIAIPISAITKDNDSFSPR